ncbi:imm11 family protein [Vibrio harveyi]|uniref:imm11 family protein n=1 Tax=Vibrio harveyi TaxID=669 RepID=UPI00165E6A22|nr:DUF1629 domain-containing protein [Vibrio harveyi]ELH4836257.1 hypothetical protein [Vibrio harveyi]
MDYNDLYYVMSPNYNDEYEVIHIIPTESAGLRRFHFRDLSYGEPAVKFIMNDSVTRNNIPSIFFCKPSFFISEKLKADFESSVYGGKLFPAVIANEKLKIENFFLVNISNELDCWSRKESVYKQKDPDYYPRVYQYRLDSAVLDKIEENERLVFRMGGSDLSPVIVHEKIKKVIEKNMDGVNFFPVKDYEFGDEY